MIAKTLLLRTELPVADAERFGRGGTRDADVDRDRIGVPALCLRRFDLGPPSIRRALVNHIRGQVAAGVYLTQTKLDVVAERMSRDCQDAVNGGTERFLRQPLPYGRGSDCPRLGKMSQF